MSSISPATPKIGHGQRGFFLSCLALVLCGASAFSALYVVQPLLPWLMIEFDVTMNQASLCLALSTSGLIVGLLFLAPLSDHIGRKPVILASSISTGILLCALSLTHNWGAFLLLRFVLGLMLGGTTAVILTWVSEEVAELSVGRTIGYVLAGNSIGGMCARLLVSAGLENFGWRAPMFGLGVMSFGAALLLMLWLPDARNFQPEGVCLSRLLSGFWQHLARPHLRRAIFHGFLLMFVFVGFFNAVTFYLISPRFALSPASAGLISLVFLPATYAAVFSSRLVDLFGLRLTSAGFLAMAIAGLALTLNDMLPLVLTGALLFTFSFFGAHSTAATAVSQGATQHRAQATALYQICFYVGATLSGSAVSLMWGLAGWSAVVALLAMALIAALIYPLMTRPE